MPDAPTTSTAAPPALAIRAVLRWDVVDRIVRRLDPRTVLEIGCGRGGFGARIASGRDYLAVEPDDTSYAVARGPIEAAGGRIVHGTHEAVAAGDTFDLVCAFEVLEHIDDDAGALDEWLPLVAPGGHLLLSVPARQDRVGPMDVEAGHFRRYSPQELSERLTAAGFVDPQIVVYAWPAGYPLEVVRNAIAKRRIGKEKGDQSAAELTAASGRILQPTNPVVGLAMKAVALPFRYAQRLRPTSGTGLVALARRPAE